MSHSEHFRVFFESQKQIDALIKQQENNLYENLSMSEEDFKNNYIQHGDYLMHVEENITFPPSLKPQYKLFNNELSRIVRKSDIQIKALYWFEGELRTE